MKSPGPSKCLAICRDEIKEGMVHADPEVKDQLKRRRHLPIPKQGQWLGRVVRGHLTGRGVLAELAVPRLSADLRPAVSNLLWININKSGAVGSATRLTRTCPVQEARSVGQAAWRAYS